MNIKSNQILRDQLDFCAFKKQSMLNSIQKIFFVAAFCSVSTVVCAQSTFAIPNPLIKPAARDQKPLDGGAQSSKAPTARQVDSGGAAGNASLLAPLPDALARSSSSASGNNGEVSVVDILSRFTVTAILGEFAVLRTHVGESISAKLAPSQVGQTTTSSFLGAGQPLDSAPLTKQVMMRVRTGHPVVVSGVTLFPVVAGSQVDFSLSGGTSVIYTAALESQSANGHVLQTANKELMDPAMVGRTTPRVAAASGGSASTQAILNPSNGVPLVGLNAQR